MPTFLHVGCGPKRKDETTRGSSTPEWQELRLDIDPSVAPDGVGTINKKGLPLIIATPSTFAILRPWPAPVRNGSKTRRFWMPRRCLSA